MAKKGKKKGKKKVIIICSLIGVLAAGTAGYVVYAKVFKKAEMPQMNVAAQTATAEIGSISNTITGTGNLALDDAQSLTVPSGVTIDEVFVESGDQVKKGQTLATVQEASVLSAMEDTQEEIQELDEQIYECQEDEDADTITASVDGRVKIIYATDDAEVSQVMLENGALMLMSLDGKMAVDLTGVAGVETEDTVSVTLSSGTVVTGTVVSASGSSCTITVTDNGTVFGDTVTVTDSDGAVLGTGELYIHQQLAVTGTAGTVADVDVYENEYVSEGTTLLTMEGTASDTKYKELLAEREARSQTLNKLISLSQNLKITADTSGTIQSVNVAASTATSSGTSSSSGSSTGSSGTGASMMSYSTVETPVIQLLSFSDSDQELVYAEQNSAKEADASEESSVSGEMVSEDYTAAAMADDLSDGTDSSDADDTGSTEEDAVSDSVLSFAIAGSGTNSAATLIVTTPVTGETPVTTADAQDGTYTGVITWNPADGTFAENTSYQALVVLYAADGYAFSAGSITGIETGTVSGITVASDGKTIEFQIAFPVTAAAQTPSPQPTNAPTQEETFGSGDSDGSSDSKEENTAGTGTSGTSGNEASGSAASGSTVTGSSAAGTQSATGSTGTDTSSATTSATSTDSSTEISASAYSTDVEAFTISANENMLLSVSVDELDINSVEEGQEAVVTFDAIEDEEFTGEVTSIGDTASVSGGVAKYTVVVSVPKDDRMKQGMNASATITIENKENIITIPMNAIQEQGDKVFVYTEEAEDGTLSGEQEVTTGLSDGSTVEITEGLSEGDTVYYNRTGNISSSSSESGFGKQGGDMSGFSGDMSNFGGGNMGGSSGGSSSGGMGGGNMGGGTPPNM